MSLLCFLDQFYSNFNYKKKKKSFFYNKKKKKHF